MDGVIVIDSEYGIKAIDIDYALVKFRMVKGERRADPVAYHSTIQKCLEAWA